MCSTMISVVHIQDVDTINVTPAQCYTIQYNSPTILLDTPFPLTFSFRRKYWVHLETHLCCPVPIWVRQNMRCTLQYNAVQYNKTTSSINTFCFIFSRQIEHEKLHKCGICCNGIGWYCIVQVLHLFHSHPVNVQYIVFFSCESIRRMLSCHWSNIQH